MKYITLTILVLGISAPFLRAQDVYLPLLSEQRTFQKRAMTVLGGWSMANVISGGIGMATTEGESRAFHQMNLGWGVINTGLAIAGYLGAKKMRVGDPQGMNLMRKNLGTSKAFLFNSGLDVGYIAGGFYLKERAKNDVRNRERLQGFGNSVILQGAFLLTFDLAAYFLNDKITQKIQSQMLSVGAQGSGVGLRLQF